MGIRGLIIIEPGDAKPESSVTRLIAEGSISERCSSKVHVACKYGFTTGTVLHKGIVIVNSPIMSPDRLVKQSFTRQNIENLKSLASSMRVFKKSVMTRADALKFARGLNYE